MTPPSAAGEDFRNRDLSRMNFGGKDLSNAQMQGATLLGTVFNGARLADANLTGAIMGRGTDFTGCDLSTTEFGDKPQFGDNPYYLTRFVGATIPYGTLGRQWRYLDLTDAVIPGLPNDLAGIAVTHCNLGGVDFSRRILTNACFSGTALAGADFRGADLTGASFTSDGPKCDLTGARFEDAAVNSVTFSGCNLAGVSFAGRKLSSVTFSNCDLTGANFAGATMRLVQFPNCDLTEANFAGIDFQSDDQNDKRGDFLRCNMTRADFTGAKLRSRVLFSGTLAGCKFDNVDLNSSHVVIQGCSGTRLDPVSFRGATLTAMWLLLANTKGLPGVDLTGATIADLATFKQNLKGLNLQNAVLTGMNLSGADLRGTDLTGATLAGVNLTDANLGGAVMYGVTSLYEMFRLRDPAECQKFIAGLKSLKVDGDVGKIFAARGYPLSAVTTKIRPDGPDRWSVVDSARTAEKKIYQAAIITVENLNGQKVSFVTVTKSDRIPRFDNATLTGAKLSPNNGERTVLRGATFTRATLIGADFTNADLGPADPSDDATAATFDHATMDTVEMKQAILTAAQLTMAKLHGANLVGAQLRKANLNAASLGNLEVTFSVPSDSPHFETLLAALQTNNPYGVAEVFATYGHPLPADVEITSPLAQRWALSHPQNQDSYRIVAATTTTGETSLLVGLPAVPATLTGAYMPDAVLTNANLMGVPASKAQLYGQVKFDGAYLDGCNLAEANLSGSALGVKVLRGVVLSSANMINATLDGVEDAQRLDLSYASLQGAVFTKSQLAGAVLACAAVSVPLVGDHCGTFLAEVSDTRLGPIVAELQRGSDPKFSITLAPGPPGTPSCDDCVAYLSQPQPDMSRIAALFKRAGVELSSAATVAPVETKPGLTWQLTDPSSPAGNFNIWRGLSKAGDPAVLARPSIPSLEAFFATTSNMGELLRQATLSRVVNADGAVVPDSWLIDNDSEDQDNTQLGYAKILVRRVSGSLLFYGTSLRIERVTEDNRIEVVPTRLAATALDGVMDGTGCLKDDTTCPNGGTLKANREKKVPWEVMLRAPTPPKPPTCIPTASQYCPPLAPSAYLDDVVEATGLGQQLG